MRKLIPAILVCLVVVVVGVLPFLRAAGTDVEDLLYTTDVGAGALYTPVRSGKALCVADAELSPAARTARILVRVDRVRDVAVDLTVRGAGGGASAVEVRKQVRGLPPGEHVVELPLTHPRATPVARVCARNDSRGALEIAAGQGGSVGFAPAPPSPLLRVDFLAGPPVPRVDRVSHALGVATLFKASIVGRGLLVGVAVLALLAVVALLVVVVRRTPAEDERS